MRRIKKPKEEQELNITSFMNLMIVLVPVLLLSMVFSQTMVLEIKLPAGASAPSEAKKETFDLGLKVFDDSFLVTYNQKALKKIDKVDDEYNYNELSTYLKQLKLTVEDKMNANNAADADYEYKRDILLSLGDDTDYQVLVKTMDTLRSYPTVVVASVVHAELFPDISLGNIEKGAKSPVLTTEGE